MADLCDYAYDDDPYEGAQIYCGLEANHEGKHKATYEWDTRPFDICLKHGHQWSRWKQAGVEVPTKVSTPYEILNTGKETFLTGALIVTAASRYRKCKRCGRLQDDAKRQPIFPRLTSLKNSLARVRPSDLGLEEKL